MVDGERHRLFLIHMLPSVERSHEMLAMQMLRSGDQNRVDAFVVEQIAVVEISLGVRRDLFRIFQALSVDIGEGHELGVRAGDGGLDVLHAAVAGPDNAEANPVVGPQNVGHSQCSGQAGSDFADEIASRLHGVKLLGG